MAKLAIPAGTTSKRIAIFLQDSSSTTGAGLTGLTNASSSLTCYSWIDTDGNVGGTSQALQTATLGTWTTRGFKEKDATNLPGFYEFGIPDALLAAGVKWAIVMFKGATNLAPCVLEIEVTAVSNQDAVRGGMTALPNANAAASGGVPILGANAVAISFTAGMTVSNASGDALTLSSSGSNGNGLAASGNGTGAGIKGTGGTTGNGAQFVGGATSGSAIKASGTAGNAIGIEIAGQGSAAGLQTTGGATGIGCLMNGGGTSGEGLFIATTNGDGVRIAPIGSSKHGMRIGGGSAGTSDGINVSAGTGGVAIRSDITGNITGNLSGSVGSVTARVTANADQLAGQTVTAGAGVTFPSSVASPTNITAGTITTVTNLTNAPTAGDFTATMKASIGTAVAASAVASVTAGVTVTTNNDKTGYALTSGERNSVADALLDRDMSTGTDSGSPTVRTPRQALRFMRNKWSIAAGTLTVTKEDDATASWTGAVTQTAGNPVSQIDPA